MKQPTVTIRNLTTKVKHPKVKQPKVKQKAKQQTVIQQKGPDTQGQKTKFQTKKLKNNQSLKHFFPFVYVFWGSNLVICTSR